MRLSLSTSLLILSQLILSLTYFGTETIIVLYLMHAFLFTQAQSLTVYGVYVGLLYTLPIFAGIISDRFIGVRNGFILGSCLSIFAYTMMLMKSSFLFSLGLSFLMVGIGFMKSNILSMVGNNTIDSASKEKNYTLLYVSNNIGATLGPLIFGLLIYKFDWNKGFIFSAICILITLCAFLCVYKELSSQKVTTRYFKSICLGVVILASALVIPFYFTQVASPIILGLFALSFIYLISMVCKKKSTARKHLIFLIILCFFGIFYYIAGMQMGSTMLLLIQSTINKEHFQFNLPASTFASLYALFVVLFSPFIRIIWIKTKRFNISVATKFAIGIILGGVSLLCFALGSIISFPLTILVIGIAFLSLGELVITPAIYTAISDYSPTDMKTSMMGCWLLFVALGSYLSTLVARFSQHYAIDLGSNIAFHEFLLDSLFVFSGGILLLLISSKLIAYFQIKNSLVSSCKNT